MQNNKKDHEQEKCSWLDDYLKIEEELIREEKQNNIKNKKKKTNNEKNKKDSKLTKTALIISSFAIGFITTIAIILIIAFLYGNYQQEASIEEIETPFSDENVYEDISKEGYSIEYLTEDETNYIIDSVKSFCNENNLDMIQYLNRGLSSVSGTQIQNNVLDLYFIAYGNDSVESSSPSSHSIKCSYNLEDRSIISITDETS